MQSALDEIGIVCYHYPLSETFGKDWTENLNFALSRLSSFLDANECVVVHCGCGNNRSRTVVEAYYYQVTGEMYQDEYKGFENHLLYIVSEKHFTMDTIRLY